MRILQIDKFLHRQGGAPAYMLDLAELQREAGHDVEFFAMADERNGPSAHTDLFVPPISLSPFPSGMSAQVRTLGHLLWSTEAKRRMEQVLDRFRPDVVHLHNIYHQLSPSILRPLARRRIPAVMTVHDAKLVCASYLLYDGNDICTACVGKRTFVRAPLHRCRGGSLPATAALAFESTAHRLLRAYDPVDVFICPSQHLEAKLRASRVYPDRLVRIPHFFDHRLVDARSGAGDGIVFAGRLSEEKGLVHLIQAVGAVPEATLRILGDGPIRAELEALGAAVAPGRVAFLGSVPKQTVLAELRSARVSVLPSVVMENLPLTITEAMAAGVPMIVTDLGGSPELVRDGETGFVVPPKDPAAFAAAIRRLLSDPGLAIEMGTKARALVERDHAPDTHLRAILATYDRAAARK